MNTYRETKKKYKKNCLRVKTWFKLGFELGLGLGQDQGQEVSCVLRPSSVPLLVLC